MKYLLDTNIISELIKPTPNRGVISFLNSLNENDILLSVITIGEIKFGIEKISSQKKKDKLLSWLDNDLLLRFKNRIVEIDTKTMLIWGELNHSLKTKGSPMPIMDSLIGATCLSHNYILITRNEKDFRRVEIEMINPFD